MKKPEEIKRDLAIWGSGITIDNGDGIFRPIGVLQGTASEVCREALEYIGQLEFRLAQVERERDAMEHDFMIDSCEACKHGHSALDDCNAPWSPCKWEWRGICEENTHDQPIL